MGLRPFVLAIDPGNLGAAVMLAPGYTIHYRQAFDGLDSFAVSKVIKDAILKVHTDVVVFKESFTAFGVNSKTAYTVGHQHGVIDLTLVELGVKKINVAPKEWQRVVHDKEQEHVKPKHLSLLASQKLFPGIEFTRSTPSGRASRVQHDGLIDAALIAYFGMHFLENNTDSCTMRVGY